MATKECAVKNAAAAVRRIQFIFFFCVSIIPKKEHTVYDQEKKSEEVRFILSFVLKM